MLFFLQYLDFTHSLGLQHKIKTRKFDWIHQRYDIQYWFRSFRWFMSFEILNVLNNSIFSSNIVLNINLKSFEEYLLVFIWNPSLDFHWLQTHSFLQSNSAYRFNLINHMFMSNLHWSVKWYIYITWIIIDRLSIWIVMFNDFRGRKGIHNWTPSHSKESLKILYSISYSASL